MGSHICTGESLVAGGEIMTLYCPICGATGKCKCGYVGVKCLTCGRFFDDHRGLTCKHRREFLGYYKDEVARMYGVKRTTVTRYEWRYDPPDKYWIFMQELTKTGERR